MNRKRILAIVMVLTLVLSSTVLAFAEVQPRETGMIVFNTNRTSRSTAETTASITFSTQVDRYTVVVYLQKNVNGSWINDTTNDDAAIYESGTTAFYHIFSNTYTDLETNIDYRLKCVCRDYVGSSSYTFTAYSNQF